MTTKNIKLYEYLRPIKSINEEYKITCDVIKTIFERFENEYNKINMSQVMKSLEEYKYVSGQEVIPEGRYIRYIDVKDPAKLKLKQGGIVVQDHKYNVKLKNLSEDYFTISKKNSIIFIKYNKNDKIRDVLEKY